MGIHPVVSRERLPKPPVRYRLTGQKHLIERGLSVVTEDGSRETGKHSGMCAIFASGDKTYVHSDGKPCAAKLVR